MDYGYIYNFMFLFFFNKNVKIIMLMVLVWLRIQTPYLFMERVKAWKIRNINCECKAMPLKDVLGMTGGFFHMQRFCFFVCLALRVYVPVPIKMQYNMQSVVLKKFYGQIWQLAKPRDGECITVLLLLLSMTTVSFTI